MNSIKNLLLLAFVFLAALGDARAEQGCPPGQIPAQAGGSMTSCGPIPAGYYQQQQTASPRPSGEWIETWGAIASDGGDNLSTLDPQGKPAQSYVPPQGRAVVAEQMVK